MSTTYSASCACGFSGTYATQSYADRALRGHSCEKHRARAAARERRLAREAKVDRTPKPCLHPVANHQHGTRTAYVLDRCRCTPCSKANAAAENSRERQKAYGRYDRYVDAEPARVHLVELAAYGIGLKRVSKLSGVSNGSLTKIVYGTYASIQGPSRGRYGKGDLLRGPAKRVLRTTAERILAVEAVPANLGPRQVDHERGPMARQHLRALVAIGWSMSELGRRVGVPSAGNAVRLITSDDPITRGTVDRIERVFAELCMTPAPALGHRQKISVSRARTYATAHGWLPPLALEDLVDVEDFERENGLLDEAAIYRRMHGDRRVRLSQAEATELVDRWAAAGRPLAECKRVTGINPHRFRHATQASSPTDAANTQTLTTDSDHQEAS